MIAYNFDSGISHMTIIIGLCKELENKFEYDFYDKKTNKQYKLNFDFLEVSGLVSCWRYACIIYFGIIAPLIMYFTGYTFGENNISKHFIYSLSLALFIGIFCVIPFISTMLAAKTVKATFVEYPKGMSIFEAKRIVMSAHTEICKAHDIIVFC